MRNYHFEGSFPNFPIVIVRARHTLMFLFFFEREKRSEFFGIRTRLKRRRAFTRISHSMLRAFEEKLQCKIENKCASARVCVCVYIYVTSSRYFEYILKQIPSFKTKLEVSWHWLCMHSHFICTGTVYLYIYAIRLLNNVNESVKRMQHSCK